MMVVTSAEITAADKIAGSVRRKSWKGIRRGFPLRLTPEVDNYVREQARRRGITITALINEALAEHALVRMK